MAQETLRQHHLSPDVAGPHGITLLVSACMLGDATAVRVLLRHGADAGLVPVTTSVLPPIWDRFKG